MKLKDLKNALSTYKGGFFGVRNYENKQGEISNYVVNVKVNYDNLKEKDIDICENFKPKTQIEVDAKDDLMEAFINPKQSTKNRSNAQIDAYVYIADGIKLHKESLDLFFVGHRVNKKVLVKGIYPIVKSRPLTIAKNKIRKLFSTSNYRSFKIGNIEDIKDFKIENKVMKFIL